MAINSSYHSIAEQIISFNNNLVSILSNLNSIATTSNPTVNLNITNSQGIPTSVTLPSFNYLQTEINRLNNNINAMYGLNGNSALIQNGNTFRKIVTVDLNLEPVDIPFITPPTNFISKANWFIDTMLSPELFINIDLSAIITDKSNSIREILGRRYILQFEIDSTGALTTNGQSALNSYNSIYKGASNINMDDFLVWHQSTPGILNPLNPRYDERIFDFNPNELQYYGLFSVLKIEEDSLNNLLWYYLNTLTYTEISTNQPKTLNIGDSLIINVNNSTTIYEIVNISNSSSNPKVTFIRTDGNDPIPVGVNTLKFYSPVLVNTTVNVNIGYDEYNVLFTKALNTDNFILSKNWSLGVGFYTGDLNLASTDSYNGQSMQQYYTSVVADYGAVLQDLSAKFIPNSLGAIPSAPVLTDTNFSVVQTNTHLTDTPNANILKSQAAQVNSLNTQLQQLSQAINAKNTQLKVTKFSTVADQMQAKNDIANLQVQYSQKSTLKSSINTEILNINSANNISSIQPTFSVRGFWTITPPIIVANTTPQNVMQYEIQYQKASKDGSITPVKTFQMNDTSVNPNAPQTAAFSNWVSIKTTPLTKTLNRSTRRYALSPNEQTNPDTINVNQLDIPISPNETIQFRIRSLSEVGWPDAPLMSPWSNTITITFPDNLNTVTNQHTTIVANAQQEEIKTSLLTTLNNQGLSGLLQQQTVINNATYYMSDDAVLSSQKDANGNALSMQATIQMLLDRISTLESAISDVQGQLQVTIFRGNTPYVISNGSQLNFTINCEDYLDVAVGPNIPPGRVFTNRIYMVNEFNMQVQNLSVTKTLGLLSNTLYTNGSNTNIYNSSAPQIFWVDSQDNLITSDSTGQSKTQLDNQFIWAVNYDSINSTTITKLSDNIGNQFITNNSNSIANILSEDVYNLGYSDPTVLNFVSNNNSLMDDSKWIDTVVSKSSTNKLLSTVHPVISQLSNIVDANPQMIHNLQGGVNNSINIPLNVYFKMNALDTTVAGIDYQYIVLNGVTQNVRHIKELKFSMATSAQEFSFSVVFTINRVNSIQKKIIQTTPSKFTA